MNENEKIENLKSELEKTTAPEGIVHKEKEVTPKKVGVGIRTYSADIAEIMRKEKGSVIKIALAEQERRRAYKEKKDPTSTKNLIVVFLGLIFILGGIMIFVFSVVNKTKPIPVSQTQVLLPGLFYTENQTQIDITNLTRGNLFSAIHSNIDASFADNNTITNIVLISTTSTGRTPSPFGMMVSKLGLKIPDKVLNSLTGNFMLGTYKQFDKGNMFLVFKIRDFNESFSLMREWEVSMINDLVRLFRINTRDYSGNIFLKNFQNAVFYNKDARAVYDDEGALVMAYVYLDKNTIMITAYAPAIEEVVKRINIQSIR